MDATNVWWHIKLGTQLPLSSLPVVAPSPPLSGATKGKMFHPDSCHFCSPQKPPQIKTKQPSKPPEQVKETFSFQSVPERAWEVAMLQFSQKILFYL